MQNGAHAIESLPQNADCGHTSSQESFDKGALNSSVLPNTATRTRVQRATVMGVLLICLFLSALDSTIITTAVPTIVSDFNAPAGYIWAGSAYLLGNASFVPIWGKAI